MEQSAPIAVPTALSCVDAVNLELTYRCNLSCRHCLQRRVGTPDRPEMSTALVKQAIYDAWSCGLTRLGINLTGGEVLLHRDDIFELLIYCQHLKIPVRLNSNSWWGQARTFRVAGRCFTHPRDLVSALHSAGLQMFAFSYDDRLNGCPQAHARLLGSMLACEEEEVCYQVVCTGCSAPELLEISSRLGRYLGMRLSFMTVVPMTMVDLGGAADCLNDRCPPGRDISGLALSADCCGRGFYHPDLLHVDPWGGVRTCLYGIGLANVGICSENLNLRHIIQDFGNDPVARNFRAARLRDCSRTLFAPFAELYKGLNHPCTACVVLARLVEAEFRLRKENGSAPNEQELRRINCETAKSLNLLSEQVNNMRQV